MNIKDLKSACSRVLTNIPGWRTDRKIVVLESDDWGSIRMPSKEVYNKCLKAGYPVDKIAYERYDTLLSQDDLELLFDMLYSFSDKNENHPVITANCVVANPDFGKIKEAQFKEYHYELITDTFRNYPAHSRNFDLWKEGIADGILYPQLHAREHLNVSLFMNALQNGNNDAHWGFANSMPGCIPLGPRVRANRYVEATNYSSKNDKNEKLTIFIEGLNLFAQLFGFKSETIIPPNYTWSPDFNESVLKQGVKFFQGNRKMREPIPGENPKYHYHYLGKKNQLGQLSLVRNAIFEPSLFRLEINDPVSHCLAEMDIAFKLKKPAIISCHRINFAGFLDAANRDRTLKLLSLLLKNAIKRWPNIEFFHSAELGRIIISNSNIQ